MSAFCTVATVSNWRDNANLKGEEYWVTTAPPSQPLVALEPAIKEPANQGDHARDGLVYDAGVVWRCGLEIGLAFGEPHDLRQMVDPHVRILPALWKEMRCADRA